MPGFNPHPPVGAGATWGVDAFDSCGGVSILTRPWGRVQRRTEVAPLPPVAAVSILTRPWGRVQLVPDLPREMVALGEFQSSPARGGGSEVCHFEQA